MSNSRILTLLCIATLLLVGHLPARAEFPAFPGAVGQGAAAEGGRGGDVYHVTTLEDYNKDQGEEKIPGSLRHAIQSAQAPRTIVFDVAGPLELSCPLEINKKSHITLAGQTSPGGVTLYGYPFEISQSLDIVVRFLRFRTGDFNAAVANKDGKPLKPASGKGNMDLLANSANGFDIGNDADRVIIDHISVSWGMDETLTVNGARNVTVQNSIIAESLNDSFHHKGPHGYGTLLRGEVTPAEQQLGAGGYTFYGNLWAHHRARNPSIAGQQRLEDGQSESDRRRTDVNLVNNVVYNWGDQPTHRSEGGDVRVNLVGNYYVNGPAKKSKHIFNEGEDGGTFLYHDGNAHDADQDGEHDGTLIDTPQRAKLAFKDFDSADELVDAATGSPHNFFNSVQDDVLPPEQAYRRVVKSAGAALWRDACDKRVIADLAHRTGQLIDSQDEWRGDDGKLPGIDDLPRASRPSDFDTDGDGMPNDFETSRGLDPDDPRDGNGTDLSEDGYTNLEVYLNSLVPDWTAR